ncbi:MAG: flippase-like domain-containing protein [Myxococcota bacterium]|nr:flippase-like domain-containing protein [Myxococcota bacterium]
MIKSLVIGLAVGAIFLALALWGVPLDQVGDAIAAMDPAWVGVGILLWAGQYWLRALRQLVMVRPLAPGTTYRTQLAVTLIGFFCVNTFPARLGEVARPFLLYEREGVPFGAGLGLVLVERILDSVALLIALLLVLAFVEVPDHAIEIAGQSVSIVDVVRKLAFLGLPPVVGGILGLAFFGTQALALGGRLVGAIEARVAAPWVSKLLRGLLGFAKSFVQALESLRDPRRFAAVVTLTVLLFVLMAGLTWALARSFGFEAWIGPGAALGVLCITMLGIALPAPPGFAGVFEAAVRAALAVFGVAGEDLAARALAFALVFHWGPYLLLALWAAWFLWRDGIALGRVFRFARGGSSDAAT